ncbi:hypothetical protein F7U74_21845 [Vibrio vulnificus]|uniref:hypothetical protein n=1 Tax=Vibrio cholerae TaxID=666 RepID=UPI00096BAAAD|nr:hypothetical protein [Vibrio cholerae]EGQ9284010.1 hypothetical protein [Vibrio vulnificus]EGQ9971620.1 hypothetical protein [Vibrio vulnificus]EHH0712213.1 hypothetical protein [Vibrio vulnificus]EHH1187228.1 hypothetical protein [Vibrio vulnificus]EHK9119026.1 hypothetical protein [Vibrio vulnificus]
MKKRNPETNKLNEGLSEDQILDAVRVSGYPLQSVIYEKLSDKFHIQEEWSFIDSDSNEERAIDLIAQLNLYDYVEPQHRVRPSLNLIIECKQSDMPYVFFLTKDNPRTPKYPVFAGLPSNNIVLTTDDDASSWSFSILQALELSEHPFLRKSTVSCNTFSKGARKGSKIELSGSQPYQGLVLPLLKATSYFEMCEKPVDTAMYFDCHLTVPIGIIDGPMVGIRTDGNDNSVEMVPWVRVLRHQASKDDHRTNTGAIDIVHKDFFDEYIEEHLIPFATEFSRLAIKHQHVLCKGKGFASGLGEDSWNNIESRLTEKKLKHSSQRSSVIFKNIVNLIKRTSK